MHGWCKLPLMTQKAIECSCLKEFEIADSLNQDWQKCWNC